MLNKLGKTVVTAMTMVITLFMTLSCSATPAFALTSDLQYDFVTENDEEFYNRGETQINFDGAVPDYLHDIYDFTPQPVYNSEYGASVITPSEPGQTPITNAPYNAPVGGYMAPPAQTTGMTAGTGSSGYTGESLPANGDAPEYYGGYTEPTNNPLPGDPNLNIASYPDYYDDDKPQYPLTAIGEVRESDGSIGTLKIKKIGLTVTAYDGDTYAAMKKGVGHISSTSCWNSTVGLVGHNRGSNDYFGKLKNLSAGDEVTYSTKLGTRTYEVREVTRISETDWSKLQYTSDNRLVLLTCVEDVPSQRLVVGAVEKR